jgi:hypothetical protein
MKYLYLTLVLQMLLFSACGQEQSPGKISGELIFHSGFEPDSKVVPRDGDADITGIDRSLSDHNDWVDSLDNHPDIGRFNLQYQGGDSTMRFARIIPEPGKDGNHVLHFWLNEANAKGERGRIQANLYGNRGMKEFYHSIRIFLHDDFNILRTFPGKIHGLTIAEYWNNITWNPSVPYRFRVTLGIAKPTGKDGELFFTIAAQDCHLFEDGRQKYTTVWAESNREVRVPTGKWFTAEYYYKEGDHENGRYYMTIEPQGGRKEVVFDLRRITHNTEDPHPDGVTDFNPFKLYTSKRLIDFMRGEERTLQIFWDDFKLWKDKRPDG